MVIMQYLLIGIVSLLSGLTASLGLGGGFILVIYLTICQYVSNSSAGSEPSVFHSDCSAVADFTR